MIFGLCAWAHASLDLEMACHRIRADVARMAFARRPIRRHEQLAVASPELR